jgi:hypothetical protein
MRLCLSAILLPILATAAREERYLVVPTTDVSAGNNATTMAPAEEEPLTNAPIPTAEKTTKDLPAGDLDVGDSSIFPVRQLTILSPYPVGKAKFIVYPLFCSIFRSPVLYRPNCQFC